MQKSLYLTRTMNTEAEAPQICRKITNSRDFNPKYPSFLFFFFLKVSITEVLSLHGNITAIINNFNIYILISILTADLIIHLSGLVLPLNSPEEHPGKFTHVKTEINQLF